MYLMKSCHAEHRISVSATIRLGTLSYYRSHPDPEIGDDGEAEMSNILIVDRAISLDARALGRVWKGGVKFGEDKILGIRRPFMMHIYNAEFGTVAKNVIVRRAQVRYTTNGSEALIFSMSGTDDRVAAPRLGYRAQWKIHAHFAEMFSRSILSSLNQAFLADPAIFIESTSTPEDLSGSRFEVRHGPVLYRDREVRLLNPNNSQLTALAKMIEDSDMVKPKRYGMQDEYRFCFRLMRGKQVLGLRKDIKYFDVPAHTLRKFLI